MKTIELSQGKFATVDDADFEAASKFNWHARRKKDSWHAVRNLPRINSKYSDKQGLHQFLLPGHGQIDHIDCDGLNNQRANLRPATGSQNCQNRKKNPGRSSRFKGVVFNKKVGCWQTQIMVQRVSVYLGLYESEIDAAHVYDYAAKIYHGEFARPNFPI